MEDESVASINVGIRSLKLVAEGGVQEDDFKTWAHCEVILADGTPFHSLWYTPFDGEGYNLSKTSAVPGTDAYYNFTRRSKEVPVHQAALQLRNARLAVTVHRGDSRQPTPSTVIGRAMTPLQPLTLGSAIKRRLVLEAPAPAEVAEGEEAVASTAVQYSGHLQLAVTASRSLLDYCTGGRWLSTKAVAVHPVPEQWLPHWDADENKLSEVAGGTAELMELANDPEANAARFVLRIDVGEGVDNRPGQGRPGYKKPAAASTPEGGEEGAAASAAGAAAAEEEQAPVPSGPPRFLYVGGGRLVLVPEPQPVVEEEPVWPPPGPAEGEDTPDPLQQPHRWELRWPDAPCAGFLHKSQAECWCDGSGTFLVGMTGGTAWGAAASVLRVASTTPLEGGTMPLPFAASEAEVAAARAAVGQEEEAAAAAAQGEAPQQPLDLASLPPAGLEAAGASGAFTAMECLPVGAGAVAGAVDPKSIGNLVLPISLVAGQGKRALSLLEPSTGGDGLMEGHVARPGGAGVSGVWPLAAADDLLRPAGGAAAEAADDAEGGDEALLERMEAEAGARAEMAGGVVEWAEAQVAASGVREAAAGGAGDDGAKGKGKDKKGGKDKGKKKDKGKGKDKKKGGKDKGKKKGGKDKGKKKGGEPEEEEPAAPPVHPWDGAGAALFLTLSTDRPLREEAAEPPQAQLTATDLVPTRSAPPPLPRGADAAAEFRRDVMVASHAIAEEFLRVAAEDEEQQGRQLVSSAADDQGRGRRRKELLRRLNTSGAYHAMKESLKRSASRIVRERFGAVAGLVKATGGAVGDASDPGFLTKLYSLLITESHKAISAVFEAADRDEAISRSQQATAASGLDSAAPSGEEEEEEAAADETQQLWRDIKAAEELAAARDIVASMLAGEGTGDIGRSGPSADKAPARSAPVRPAWPARLRAATPPVLARVPAALDVGRLLAPTHSLSVATSGAALGPTPPLTGEGALVHPEASADGEAALGSVTQALRVEEGPIKSAEGPGERLARLAAEAEVAGCHERALSLHQSRIALAERRAYGAGTADAVPGAFDPAVWCDYALALLRVTQESRGAGRGGLSLTRGAAGMRIAECLRECLSIDPKYGPALLALSALLAARAELVQAETFARAAVGVYAAAAGQAERVEAVLSGAEAHDGRAIVLAEASANGAAAAEAAALATALHAFVCERLAEKQGRTATGLRGRAAAEAGSHRAGAVVGGGGGEEAEAKRKAGQYAGAAARSISLAIGLLRGAQRWRRWALAEDMPEEEPTAEEQEELDLAAYVSELAAEGQTQLLATRGMEPPRPAILAGAYPSHCLLTRFFLCLRLTALAAQTHAAAVDGAADEEVGAAARCDLLLHEAELWRQADLQDGPASAGTAFNQLRSASSDLAAAVSIASSPLSRANRLLREAAEVSGASGLGSRSDVWHLLAQVMSSQGNGGQARVALESAVGGWNDPEAASDPLLLLRLASAYANEYEAKAGFGGPAAILLAGARAGGSVGAADGAARTVAQAAVGEPVRGSILRRVLRETEAGEALADDGAAPREEELLAGAKEIFLRAARACGWSRAWLGAGRVALWQGRLAEAEAGLSEANVRDVEHPLPWAWLALSSLCRRPAPREAEAALALDKAGKAYCGRVKPVASGANRPASGAKAWDQGAALELAGERALLWELAAMYNRLGRSRLAEACARQSIADCGNPDVVVVGEWGLATMLHRRGDIAAARKELATIINSGSASLAVNSVREAAAEQIDQLPPQ